MESFPRLEALLRANAAGYQRIMDGDPDGIARGEAELLLERADDGNVGGLEKLATDGTAGVSKFVNVVAELRFALLFGSLGARSDLLPDGAFGPGMYSPDLLVQLRDGMQILVEVIRGSSGSPRLAEALSAQLLERDLPFTVEHFLGNELSIPASTHAEHAASDRLCAEVANEIAIGLSVAWRSGITDGLLRVFRNAVGLRHELSQERSALYGVAMVGGGETWIGSFGFELSVTGQGSAGGGVTSAHITGNAKCGERFLRNVREKAEKRNRIPRQHLADAFHRCDAERRVRSSTGHGSVSADGIAQLDGTRRDCTNTGSAESRRDRPCGMVRVSVATKMEGRPIEKFEGLDG